MSKSASYADTDGMNAPPPAGAVKAATRPRDARQARLGQAFAQVVAVLMRDPNFKNLRLSDLEWLALPPVMAGQFRLGHAARPVGASSAEEGGIAVPVAVALWARVSPRLDKSFSQGLDQNMRLRANEWASGDRLWLIAAGGDPRAVPPFLKQLAENEFKGKQVKMRVRGHDGKVAVKTLGQPA